MGEDVILVAGLPGSGKTTLLCRMSHDGWLVFDDYKAGGPDLIFRSSPRLRDLISALRAGLKCTVADIDFCETRSREEAERVLLEEVPGLTLRWRFFENDASACEANVRSRNSPSRELELKKVRDYSASYQIPDGADVLPIVRNAELRITEN
jgi:hypothetical protein